MPIGIPTTCLYSLVPNRIKCCPTKRSAHHIQTRICVHIWTKNSDGFLMLCVQKVCVEPILTSLNPISHRSYTIFYNRVFILVNSADPDETPRFASSHLGLRCLYMFLFRMHSACSTSAYTLKLRLATPLALSFSLRRARGHHELQTMVGKRACRLSHNIHVLTHFF